MLLIPDVVCSIIGFDELGGHDDFPTMHLEWLLAKWKVACAGRLFFVVTFLKSRWQVIHYEGDVGEHPPELVMPKKTFTAR